MHTDTDRLMYAALLFTLSLFQSMLRRISFYRYSYSSTRRTA
ncbi:hypothetical protein APHWI1_0768 [Anaplasma phagocytophilum str. ApWI1]|uniref:Uncharacterized protein n=1 Tax=Anaplasma phagocytophilum str. ApWI1 TaxID=1359155 RepID=A0A0F3Q220_ANAPH|nr:hypothetical protein APHWEB_0750 [Anaplasma phagocytophilum str. Webster]KJV82679.1 hypothetical protein APHHGE2_0003 [Anaplasma phagocytophilum str. HGE2]KJV84214.1 hypothetical protein APHWI1_0608 [Anaplasma phagocytophilum str. ApWI1]KJV87222.1 hypothetical protein APHNYW_1277 [Anaplasma phagocytophilum str. ApNYW]KJV98046.1 hypothetical protein OTSANNIE_1538 [Anaplasma phagocytophilum str. Annie]